MQKVSIILILFFTSITDNLLAQQESNVSTTPDEVTIEYSKKFWITSEKVAGQEFLIKVALPMSYFKSDTSVYPVLYLTDADAYFGMASDYAHWLQTEIITVGISYGSREKGWKRRGVDLRPYPNDKGVIGAEYFWAFIREELIPKVETEFRIDSSNRTLFGWSAGGRFALYTLFQQPELFNNYLVLGTPLTSRNRWAFKMEDEYFQKRKDLPALLYMGVGRDDLLAYISFPEFVQTLENRRYKGLQFKWKILKDRRHELKATTELMLDGLFYIYGISIGTPVTKIINEQSVEKAIAEYRRLKRMQPNEYRFFEAALNWVGYGLMRSNRIQEAIEIFKFNSEEYPDSWGVYDSLGEAYVAAGNITLAIKNYEKALSLSPESEHDYIKNQLKKLRE
jgi:predicted alpha/beta superfamily hydrolase